MDDAVTTMLDGPIGVAVRISALALIGAVVIWVITGIRLVGDDEGARHSGIIRRVLVGIACIAVLVPMAVDPVAVVSWARDQITAIAEGLTSR